MVLASCSAGTMLIAWCWWGSNLVPVAGLITTTLLRSSAPVSWRSVASEPSRNCSAVALSMDRAASRLSQTGSRLSAKLSMPNLRALETSSSARRRAFSASAFARRNWSASSALLALSSASSPCRRASSSVALAAVAASISSGLRAGFWFWVSDMLATVELDLGCLSAAHGCGLGDFKLQAARWFTAATCCHWRDLWRWRSERQCTSFAARATMPGFALPHCYTTRRVVSSKRSLHASLRNHFVDPSGSERAGSGHAGALQGHDHRRRWPGAPRGRLGPPPAGLPDQQARQGTLPVLEYRGRPGRDGRARARLQVQRRRAAPPDGAKEEGRDRSFFHDEDRRARRSTQGQPGRVCLDRALIDPPVRQEV